MLVQRGFGFTLAACAMIGVLACRSSSSVDVEPATLDGTWTQLSTIPGSGETWALRLTGSTVSGTGTWSGEACCSGTLSISGTATRDSVHLDITFLRTAPIKDTVTYTKEHVDAVLQTASDLVGTLVEPDGSTAPFHFRKTEQ